MPAALRLALGVLVALVLTLALVAPPRAAAAPVGCGYGSGGPYASTLCWLDMSAYDDAQASTAAGQDMTVTLPGDYTAAFNVIRRPQGGNATRGVAAVPFPTLPGDIIGNPYYAGTPGRPALYTGPGPGPTATTVNDAYDVVTLRNIVVTDSAGAAVTGYALVGADAEVTGDAERITWNSDKPIDLVAAISPTPNSRGCQRNITGLGTTTVSCTDTSAPGSGQSGSVIVKSVGATTFSQTLYEHFSGGREAVAFAFMTAKVELAKTVVNRVAADDSFDLSVTSPEGTLVGSATTGAAATATTDELTVLPRADDSVYTLGETATAGTGTLLDDYAEAWSCTNNGVADPSLPSGGGLTKTVSPQPGDDIACTITNTGTPYADLGIEKTAPATVAPNGEIAWNLTVTNHGRSVSTGSTVRDELPQGVTDAATSTPGCTIAGATLECAIGALPVGESRTVAVRAKAPATSSTCVVNGASVVGDEPDPEAANDAATATTCTTPPTPLVPPVPPVPPTPPVPPVISVYDLTLTKSASRKTVKVGDRVVYKLLAKNVGPGVAPGVVVTDAVPQALKVRSASSSQGSCAVTGNDVRCAVGTLTAGQSATVTVEAVAVKVGTVTNSGVVVPPPGSPDDPKDNTGTVTVKVVKPTLGLRKSVNRSSLRPGQTATYAIRTRNPSRATVRNVKTCDRLPSGLVYVSSSPKAKQTRGQYCWTAKSLKPGASKTYRLTARALRGTSGTKVNRATATSPDAKKKVAKRSVRVLRSAVKSGGVTG